MKKIALLSCDSLEGFFCYDEMLVEPFAGRGFDAELISWRAQVDWNEYEAVIVRATWDYQDHFKEFDETLDKINSSSARLLNPLEIIKWNFSKLYLQELEQKGVDIIPSHFSNSFDFDLAYDLYSKYQCEEIIIKPCVSANSDDTFRLNVSELCNQTQKLKELFNGRDHMYQPFIPSVIQNGEYSLFYFGGEFSHAILKTPKDGDFRVQEEHGGRLQKIIPSEKMLQASSKIIAEIVPSPLYARIDLVEYENKYLLMEVELIEPSLYFNLDDKSAGRFVEAYINSR